MRLSRLNGYLTSFNSKRYGTLTAKNLLDLQIYLIRDQVVNVLRPSRPWETHVRHLYRRRAQCKDLVPGSLGVTVQVNQNLDLILGNLGSNLLRGGRRYVEEVLRLRRDPLAPLGAVVDAQGIAEDLVHETLRYLKFASSLVSDASVGFRSLTKRLH